MGGIAAMSDEGIFFGARTMRQRRQSGLPMALPCPADFEETFIEIGRLACQEHYRVGRSTINRWLSERGKDTLIRKRAEHAGRFSPVAAEERRGPVRAAFLDELGSGATVDAAARSAGVSPQCVYRWRKDPDFAAAWDERVTTRRLSVEEMSAVLKRAFPMRERISLALVRRAAQHLRIRRNGGFIVSPCPDGDWRVGARRVSAAQLVEMAVRAGFGEE